MATKWTQSETCFLEDLLSDGVSIQKIQLSIRRNETSISKKAYSYSYRTETINGTKVLKKGITRRDTGVPEYEKLAKEYPDHILYKTAFHDACNLFEGSNIIVDSSIIHTLSEQIFKSMREGTYYGK